MSWQQLSNSYTGKVGLQSQRSHWKWFNIAIIDHNYASVQWTVNLYIYSLFLFLHAPAVFPVSSAWSGLWNLMDLWSYVHIIMIVKISIWHIAPDSPQLLKINVFLCFEILIKENNLEVSIWHIVRGYMNRAGNYLAFYPNKSLSSMEWVFSEILLQSSSPEHNRTWILRN